MDLAIALTYGTGARKGNKGSFGLRAVLCVPIARYLGI